MEIRYFSTSVPWSEYESHWNMGLENRAHVVQYNVQPGDICAFIKAENGQISITKGRWGRSASDTVLMFNARREGIFSQNSFRFAMRDRRCIVPLDSFYHVVYHPTEGTSAYRIKPRQAKPGFAAALYSEKGDFITLITRKCPTKIGDMCDRSPVMLTSKEDIHLWLESRDMEQLDLLLSADTIQWEFYCISSEIIHHINSPILHQARHKDLTLFD